MPKPDMVTHTHTPVIIALRRRGRQEDQTFKVLLSYIASESIQDA